MLIFYLFRLHKFIFFKWLLILCIFEKSIGSIEIGSVGAMYVMIECLYTDLNLLLWRGETFDEISTFREG